MELRVCDDNRDELFQLMKEQMNTEQEQIFMESHYLYLQHGTDNTKFVVDFDNVWKNVDFTQKVNAKRLLEKHFTEQIDYKKLKLSETNANYYDNLALLLGRASCADTVWGGQNKETIFLTVDCFKNFCMIASTPKAKTVRSYYIKMENIMHEYFKTTSRELQTTLHLAKSALKNSIRETAMKRHEVLIESNKNKCVVYFCMIKLHEDGSFILKIGESTDIKNRIDALSCDFGVAVIVLDIFHCENSLRFEKFLHNSAEIVKYKYNMLEHKNKKLSTEAYRIPNQKEYDNIVKFTRSELSKYNSIEMMKLRIEEKRIDLISSLIPLCKNHDEIMNILNTIKTPFATDTTLDTDKPIVCEDTNVYSKQEEPSSEKIASSNGPIVQIYHKDNLNKVVQVFASITEATRIFNYNNLTASFTAVKNAYRHKTLYLEHRWHFITDRQAVDLEKARDIGATVVTQERNQGRVAMLNIDKTKIIKVFRLSKDAAKDILQHPSAMCCAIKHSTPLNNYYWFRWENVASTLQNEFLQSNPLPVKHHNVRGTKINLLQPNTNEIIKIFTSYTEIQKELKISVRKIKELIESNESYNGKYRFKLG